MGDDTIDDIERLESLRARGALSDDEFEALKRHALAGSTARQAESRAPAALMDSSGPGADVRAAWTERNGLLLMGIALAGVAFVFFAIDAVDVVRRLIETCYWPWPNLGPATAAIVAVGAAAAGLSLVGLRRSVRQPSTATTATILGVSSVAVIGAIVLWLIPQNCNPYL